MFTSIERLDRVHCRRKSNESSFDEILCEQSISCSQIDIEISRTKNNFVPEKERHRRVTAMAVPDCTQQQQQQQEANSVESRERDADPMVISLVEVKKTHPLLPQSLLLLEKKGL
jgi:hypothetical protein